MPGRNFSQSNSSYRYGFNGKENDKDISEGGQDYGMRIYDGRLGRFLSVDPITKNYPMLTPYQFASNRPIEGIDLDGLEFMKMGTAAFYLQPFAYRSNAFGMTGIIYKGKEELVLRSKAAYEISAEHIEAAFKVAEKYDPVDMRPRDDKKEDKGIRGLKKSTGTSNRIADKSAKAADAVCELYDAGKMIEVLKNMYQESHSGPEKANLEAGNSTWAYFANANTLVKLASENPTFPSKLNTTEIKTDLVNYILDFTTPKEPLTDPYSSTIAIWGKLIYDHKEAISNMNFSPVVPSSVTDNHLDGVPIIRNFQIGNPDPAVQKANDNIKPGVPASGATLKPGG